LAMLAAACSADAFPTAAENTSAIEDDESDMSEGDPQLEATDILSFHGHLPLSDEQKGLLAAIEARPTTASVRLARLAANAIGVLTVRDTVSIRVTPTERFS